MHRPIRRAAVALAAMLLFPAAGEPPESVSGHFGECNAGGAALCVVDGDTFRIGERRVRVVGIDTAERRARCEAERVQAQASTAALQRWLNRGEFVMQTSGARAIDRYGRELRVLSRISADGQVDALAEWMQAEGGARVYGGGARSGWC